MPNNWKKEYEKNLKQATLLAGELAYALIDNGAWDKLKPEELAQYAIDVAEGIYSVDIDGSDEDEDND